MKLSTLLRFAFWCCLILVNRVRGDIPLALKPDGMLIYGLAGFTGSRLETRGDMRHYFDPVSKAEPATAASFGIEAEVWWRGHWSLSTGLRRERVGQTSPSSRVSFQGNPFPHDLKTETWIDYLVLPLKAGFGLAGRRQHLFVQGGVYAAAVQDSRLSWTVDGSAYGGAPAPTPQNDNGWLLGLEYGWRLGRGTIIFGADSRQGFSSLASGLPGSAYASTASTWLGYGYSMW